MSGDKYECETCGASVVTRFGSSKFCGFQMTDAQYQKNLEYVADPRTGFDLVVPEYPH